LAKKLGGQVDRADLEQVENRFRKTTEAINKNVDEVAATQDDIAATQSVAALIATADQVAAQAAQSKAARRKADPEVLRLGRNFLHAAKLEFAHPVTGKVLQLEAPLPDELEGFLKKLESGAGAGSAGGRSK